MTDHLAFSRDNLILLLSFLQGGLNPLSLLSSMTNLYLFAYELIFLSYGEDLILPLLNEPVKQF